MADHPLLDALAESNRQGPLGESPERALAVGRRFCALVPAGRVIDLGAGGGIPGLVIAWDRPDVELVMLDRRARRTDLLSRLVRRLGLDDRCTVVTDDAALFGRVLENRGSFDAVVTRSFGQPALVAEMAAPLLVSGGVLLVSEPPDHPDNRWPAEGLARVGLRVEGMENGIRSLRQTAECGPEWPRRRPNPPLFAP